MSSSEVVEYNNKVFNIPKISEERGYFGIDFWSDHEELRKSFVRNQLNPLFQRIGKIWNQDFFNQKNPPVFLGDPDFWSVNPDECTRVLDMPIKFSGSDEFRIPKEFLSLYGVIERAAYFEKRINPNFKDYYCYLTVDNSYVSTGDTQRNSGFHVDGFQGSRIQQKLPVDRSYLICDHTPTLFTDCSFNTSHLSTEKDNFFEFFDEQIGDNFYNGKVNNLTLIDAFCVHAAQKQKFSDHRSFVRISFTVREFDRLGNTHNPFFEYDWEMVARNFQQDFDK